MQSNTCKQLSFCQSSSQDFLNVFTSGSPAQQRFAKLCETSIMHMWFNFV